MRNNSSQEPSEVLPESIQDKFKTLLASYPDALQFILEWVEYINMIDDIIDDPLKRSSNEYVLRTFLKAADVYSLPFYRAHAQVLWPLVTVITNTYMDVVKWERSASSLKNSHADALRHTGYDMIFMVIRLTLGVIKLREVSEDLRFYAHFTYDKSRESITNQREFAYGKT